jgi:hypothetical protein
MVGLAGGRIAVDVKREDREFVPFGELRERLNAEKKEAGNSRLLAGSILQAGSSLLISPKMLRIYLWPASLAAASPNGCAPRQRV